MEKIASTQNVEERLKAHAAKLERDIAEAREGLAELELECASLREHQPGKFDHSGYEAAQRRSYFERKIDRSQTVSNEFYEQFPEYKPVSSQ